MKGRTGMAANKTPLYEKHVVSGGKIVEYAGYMLPVQYESGIKTEHLAVRNAAGLFDVSHMGRFTFKGADAETNIQRLVTNNIAGMKQGGIKYSLLCDDNGGMYDDILVYRVNDGYMMVVNASNREKDYKHIQGNLSGDCELADMSDDTAMVALQGPKAVEILTKVVASVPEKYYTISEGLECGNYKISASRTGYTGEDGFELFCAKENAEDLWDKLIEAGKEYGLIPCGLGARDTLRIEAGMPLYGHEISHYVDPITAELGFAVKFDKDFIGKTALEKIEPVNKRIGLKVTGKGIIREECKIYAEDEEVGFVSSGTFSPTFGYSIGIGYIRKERGEVGDVVSVDVRGKKIDAEIVALPFYSRKK